MSKRDRVRRPAGPLGPWRLSLSVVVSTAFTGMPLFRAATTGIGLDIALERSFAAGFFTWVVVSIVNRVIATAEASVDHDRSQLMIDDEPAPGSSVSMG